MPQGAWLVLVIFGLAALQSAVGLVTFRARQSGETIFSTPEADATHLLMNAVMALMVTPAYTARARSAAVLLLVLVAVGVALAIIRHRPGAPSAGPLSFGAYTVATAYHVLMLAAMIYALLFMAPSMGAMESSTAGAMAPRTPSFGHVFTLPRVLAAVFALDAITGALAVIALPGQLLAIEASAMPAGALSRGRRVWALRIGFVPHLVMDAGMIWMLSGG